MPLSDKIYHSPQALRGLPPAQLSFRLGQPQINRLQLRGLRHPALPQKKGRFRRHPRRLLIQQVGRRQPESADGIF